METKTNNEIIEPETLEMDFGNEILPNKMFFKIGEVAEITGLKPYVLRFWESEFKELAPKKASNNQRKYTRNEVNTLLTIKTLLYDEKYTIDGARQKLKAIKQGKATLSNKTQEELQNTYKKKLAEIKQSATELKLALEKELSNLNY